MEEPLRPLFCNWVSAPLLFFKGEKNSLKILFIHLSQSKRERASVQVGEGAGGEGEAGSPPLCPRTLRS